jgi:hypothetical protein
MKDILYLNLIKEFNFYKITLELIQNIFKFYSLYFFRIEWYLIICLQEKYILAVILDLDNYFEEVLELKWQ